MHEWDIVNCKQEYARYVAHVSGQICSRGLELFTLPSIIYFVVLLMRIREDILIKFVIFQTFSLTQILESLLISKKQTISR